MCEYKRRDGDDSVDIIYVTARNEGCKTVASRRHSSDVRHSGTSIFILGKVLRVLRSRLSPTHRSVTRERSIAQRLGKRRQIWRFVRAFMPKR